MVYYFIFLSIIFIIYFFFAYDLKVRIKFDFSSLVVKVFFIPIICLKGNRYKKFLKKLIPRNKNQMMKEIDTTALISLVHFHKLRIDVYQNVNDYLFYVFLQESLISINYMLSNLIKDYVENYFFKIEQANKSNIKIDSIFHFNLGIILLNLWLIKRRYRHVQETD